MQNEKSTALSVSSIDVTKISTIDDYLAAGQAIINSGMTPMKKAEDVMCAALFGKELGMSFMVSVNNIYAIQGRASVGIHVIQALLLKNGIKYTVTKDFETEYVYKAKGGRIYTEDFYHKNIDKFQIITAETPDTLYDKTKIQVIVSADDTVTEVEFERRSKFQDGTPYTQVHKQQYRLSTARSSGYLTKDNWKNDPANMLRVRCMALGARFIADDVLLGVLETSEVADIYNLNTNITEDGEVTIINSPTNTAN